MVKQVNTAASKAAARKGLRVRFSPRGPLIKRTQTNKEVAVQKELFYWDNPSGGRTVGRATAVFTPRWWALGGWVGVGRNGSFKVSLDIGPLFGEFEVWRA